MKGYWNLPDATGAVISPDGWFSTGDTAVSIATATTTLSTAETPHHLRGLQRLPPRNRRSALRASRDHRCRRARYPASIAGEEVGAAVVLKHGAAASADEIREFVKQHVAAYKYPLLIWFVEDLPKPKLLRPE